MPINASEYFLIANHQRTGFDQLYEGTGLLAWHIKSTSIWDIECADGKHTGGNPDPVSGTDLLDQATSVYNGSSLDFFNGASIQNFSPSTNPSSKGYNGWSRTSPENIISHKAILNIRQKPEDSDVILADFITNYWSGTLPSSMTWTTANSPYTIGGDITVPAGVTLTIQSGVTVNFLRNQDDESGGIDANKIEFIVEGTLIADGVTFTSSQIANSWYGIVFDNASPSWASTIENSTIEWAYRGIRVINSGVTLENNVLYANQYGIWSTSSGLPLITHNEIERSAYGVVVSSDGFAALENNKISALNGCIYIASGGRVMAATNNDLLGYTGYGADRQIYTTGSSSQGYFGAYNGQGNFFSDDITDGVCWLDGGYPYDFHYNIFEGASIGLYIANFTGYQVDAENNYWDNGGTPDSYNFLGSVDYTPALATQPTAGATWKVTASPFAAGYDYFNNRDFRQAAQSLRTALDNNFEHPEASKALSLYARAIRELKERTGHLNYFNNILSSFRDDGKGQVARSFMLNYYADANDLSKAESVALSAPAGAFADRELLLDMVYRYALNQDETGEKRVVEILQNRYADDEKLAFSIAAAKELVPDELAYLRYKGKSGNDTNPDVTLNTQNEQGIAFGAYPNPFNPVTKLNYSLNEDQRVAIKIYNLLGEEVRTLFVGMQPKGAHEITWDAKDNTGSNVASGVYVAQMVTNQKAVAQKILYLK